MSTSELLERLQSEVDQHLLEARQMTNEDNVEQLERKLQDLMDRMAARSGWSAPRFPIRAPVRFQRMLSWTRHTTAMGLRRISASP